MREHRIAVIRGDGIGPELVDAALDVLHAVVELDGAFRLHIRFVDAGARAYLETGTSMSAEDLTACAESDAILKGPVGLPDVRRPDGTEAGLLGGTLRGTLDLYANVRPVTLWPCVETRVRHERPVDYVIVRENTEGLHASRGLGVANRWAAADTLLMTRPAVERIVRYAFDLAVRRARAAPERGPHVTCVDKGNVLKSFAFFRAIFDEVAREHPDVGADHLHTDAAAQALVLEPRTAWMSSSWRTSSVTS
jgi:isocitrate/isopropylmalate dehydrogenase